MATGSAGAGKIPKRLKGVNIVAMVHCNGWC